MCGMVYVGLCFKKCVCVRRFVSSWCLYVCYRGIMLVFVCVFVFRMVLEYGLLDILKQVSVDHHRLSRRQL